MKNKEQRPLKIRFLAAIGSMLLLGSVLYIAFAGINYYAGAVLAIAIFGLAAPGVVAGDGIMEMITEFFEMVISGIMEIITAIFEAISSIFS